MGLTKEMPRMIGRNDKDNERSLYLGADATTEVTENPLDRASY